MSFTPEQKEALSAPLDRQHVRQRTQAKRTFDYIEGWKAIDEANRIFGFDAWSSETIDIRCVSERERRIGKDQYARDGWAVTYTARVRITVRVGEQVVIREGVGAGHGIDVDPGQAHESAIKEAETDARKRGLMTFGNPFGLALYDKEQRNVADAPPPAPEIDEADEYVSKALSTIEALGNKRALETWWNNDKEKRRALALRPDEVALLKKAVTDRLAVLAPQSVEPAPEAVAA